MCMLLPQDVNNDGVPDVLIGTSGILYPGGGPVTVSTNDHGVRFLRTIAYFMLCCREAW